mgnify:CR=1 FL=1
MSMFDDVLGMGRTSIIEGAYEPEVEAITLESAEDIPDYMDPMEFMTQVACEQEMNMQKLDMAIMAEEYIYLRENGEEMVTESGTVQSIIDKFKKGVDWLWSKIQSFFKTVQTKISEAIKLDDRFLTKYADAKKCKEKVKISCAIKKTDTDATAAEAELIYTDMARHAREIFDNIGSDKKKTADQLIKAYYKNTFGVMEFKKDKGDNATPKAYMKRMLGDKIDGGKDGKLKEEREFDPKTAIDDFRKSKAVKEKLKKSYNSNKKIINSFYKAAKKMETLAKKAKVLPTDESKNIHVSVKMLNMLGKDLTIVNKAYVKIINEQRSIAKQVIVRAATIASGAVRDAEKQLSKNTKAANKHAEKSGSVYRVESESSSFIDAVQFGEEW